MDIPRHKTDLTGMRFGKLLVLEFFGITKSFCYKWRCLCDCGNEKIIGAGELARTAKSCGCYTKARTHGEHASPEYRAWYAMISRTTNPSNQYFKNYGARGITVCDRWRQSVKAFIEDMGRRPSSEYSLDRIDNEGNYEPDNCRWTDRKTQQRNRRNSVMITYNGETRPFAEWVEISGIDRNVLRNRLLSGWDMTKAMSTPSRRKKRSQ